MQPDSWANRKTVSSEESRGRALRSNVTSWPSGELKPGPSVWQPAGRSLPGGLHTRRGIRRSEIWSAAGSSSPLPCRLSRHSGAGRRRRARRCVCLPLWGSRSARPSNGRCNDMFRKPNPYSNGTVPLTGCPPPLRTFNSPGSPDLGSAASDGDQSQVRIDSRDVSSVAGNNNLPRPSRADYDVGVDDIRRGGLGQRESGAVASGPLSGTRCVAARRMRRESRACLAGLRIA
jgi:hypothetical protein